MSTTRPILNQKEYEELRTALLKHKLYPFKYRINKAITIGNFPTADGSATARYFSFQFTPPQATGIVTLATNLIITPETTFDIFGIVASFAPALTLADNPSLTVPGDEANDWYELVLNGGAINDFQVFFPLNVFVEARQTIYFHVFAGNTTVTAATSTMRGQIILGTLPLTN